MLDPQASLTAGVAGATALAGQETVDDPFAGTTGPDGTTVLLKVCVHVLVHPANVAV
jgi:hypothetical protein